MAKRIPENIIDDVIAAADLVEVMTDFLGTYDQNNPGGLRKKALTTPAFAHSMRTITTVT
jgi:hypothetical protein